MSKRIRYYDDADCTQELKIIEFDNIVKTGESDDKTVYLKNDGENEIINIEVELGEGGEDVSIIQSPEKLDKDEVQPLTLKWSPPLELETALQFQMEITADVIVRPIEVKL